MIFIADLAAPLLMFLFLSSGRILLSSLLFLLAVIVKVLFVIFSKQ